MSHKVAIGLDIWWPHTSSIRSAAGHQLVVPSYRLNSCGLRAFSVLGPRLWNSLPRLLRDTGHNTTSFGHSFKTFSLSQSTSAYSALGASAIMRYTNLRFTYLLTYTRQYRQLNNNVSVLSLWCYTLPADAAEIQQLRVTMTTTMTTLIEERLVQDGVHLPPVVRRRIV